MTFVCSVVLLTATDEVVLLLVGLAEAKTTRSLWENYTSLLAAGAVAIVVIVVVDGIVVVGESIKLSTLDTIGTPLLVDVDVDVFMVVVAVTVLTSDVID